MTTAVGSGGRQVAPGLGEVRPARAPGAWYQWAYALSVGLFVAVWSVAAEVKGAYLVPSPAETVSSAAKLLLDGMLGESIAMSYLRVLGGWVGGGLLGIPLGLLMGRLRAVRILATPYIQFLRFISPIALVTLFLIWFGIGEESKIALVFYAAVFLVTLNTMAGVLAVKPGLLRAARSLGANETQAFLYAAIPQVIPFAVTGLRIAMGSSFMTVISAEMLSARSGIGFTIWDARGLGRTDHVFVGIIVLGLMGFTADWLFRYVTRALLGKYGVKA